MLQSIFYSVSSSRTDNVRPSITGISCLEHQTLCTRLCLNWSTTLFSIFKVFHLGLPGPNYEVGWGQIDCMLKFWPDVLIKKICSPPLMATNISTFPNNVLMSEKQVYQEMRQKYHYGYGYGNETRSIIPGAPPFFIQRFMDILIISELLSKLPQPFRTERKWGRT